MTKVARYTSPNICDVSFEFWSNGKLDVSKLKFEDVIEESDKNCNKVEDEIKFAFFAEMSGDPTSYREAIHSKEKEKWKAAVEVEIKSMKKNEVWTLVERPNRMKDGRRANIIDSKWVFKKSVDYCHSTRNIWKIIFLGGDRCTYVII
jgi:hypothetical protein